MSERIDQFCESLRVKLTHIDENLQGLKAKIDTEAKDADQVVRTHLASVKKRIEQGRAKATAAQNDMKKWLDERKATTDEKVAEWKAKLDQAKLRSRADSAKLYASAAALMASAAIDEAEQAALEAWLARKDAESAKQTKAA